MATLIPYRLLVRVKTTDKKIIMPTCSDTYEGMFPLCQHSETITEEFDGSRQIGCMNQFSENTLHYDRSKAHYLVLISLLLI